MQVRGLCCMSRMQVTNIARLDMGCLQPASDSEAEITSSLLQPSRVKLS